MLPVLEAFLEESAVLSLLFRMAMVIHYTMVFFTTKKGELIRPNSWDPNPLVECTNGIHFFITKEEAEQYNC